MCEVSKSKITLLLTLFGYPTGENAKVFNRKGKSFGECNACKTSQEERATDLFDMLKWKLARGSKTVTIKEAIKISKLSEPTVRRAFKWLVQKEKLVIVHITSRWVTYKLPDA